MINIQSGSYVRCNRWVYLCPESILVRRCNAAISGARMWCFRQLYLTALLKTLFDSFVRQLCSCDGLLCDDLPYGLLCDGLLYPGLLYDDLVCDVYMMTFHEIMFSDGLLIVSDMRSVGRSVLVTDKETRLKKTEEDAWKTKKNQTTDNCQKINQTKRVHKSCTMPDFSLTPDHPSHRTTYSTSPAPRTPPAHTATPPAYTATPHYPAQLPHTTPLNYPAHPTPWGPSQNKSVSSTRSQK